MCVANGCLLAYSTYGLTFAATTLFFTVAFLPAYVRIRAVGPRLLAAPYYICMLKAAGLVAFYRIFSGKRTVAW